MMPPSVAIGPMEWRMRSLRSLSSSGGESDDDCVDVAAKANGRWPFRESGMGTTQASVIEGCAEMACSIAPAMGQYLLLICKEC